MTVQTGQPDLSALTANAFVEAAKKHLAENRPRQAVVILETAVQLWPKNGRVLHQLGMAMLAAGKGEGVQRLVEAIGQDPTNVDRLADLAEACEAVNDPGAGRAWFRRTVARGPSRADLVLRFAAMLTRAKRYDEGEVWCRRAIMLKPRFGHAHSTLGTVLERRGRIGEALASFNRAVQVEPEFSEGYVYLAGALHRAGATEEQVIGPLRIVADRYPDRTDVISPVVQFLRDRGKEETYVEYATRLIDLEMEKVALDEFGAYGFRIIMVDSILSRIGEIALQLDMHIKMKMLGWVPPFVSIMLAPREQVCNWPFLDYYRPFVTIVDDPQLIEKLTPLKKRVPFNIVYVRMPDGRAISKSRGYFAVQEEWQRQGRDALLQLSQPHIERGREGLRQMGIPEGAWFVCVHMREPGFLQEGTVSSESARNSNISAYLPAIEEITRRGGWVVRIGDATMTPLPPMPQVVDYAVSPFKSEDMDVFLLASCRFLLGTTSGPVMVSEVFGVPVGAADYYPIGGLLHTSKDVIIPKPYREKATGRMLQFEEYLKMPLAFTYDSEYFDSLGLEALSSEAEDIVDLAIEMLERTEGRWPYDAEDEKLNARWHEISRSFTLGQVGCRVGRGFLRRHRHLFQSV